MSSSPPTSSQPRYQAFAPRALCLVGSVATRCSPVLTSGAAVRPHTAGSAQTRGQPKRSSGTRAGSRIEPPPSRVPGLPRVELQSLPAPCTSSWSLPATFTAPSVFAPPASYASGDQRTSGSVSALTVTVGPPPDHRWHEPQRPSNGRAGVGPTFSSVVSRRAAVRRGAVMAGPVAAHRVVRGHHGAAKMLALDPRSGGACFSAVRGRSVA